MSEVSSFRRGQDQAEVAEEATPRRVQASPAVEYSRKQGTKAPSSKHFERLEACMQEYLDEGDEFSRRQAGSILAGMAALVDVDITL